MSEYCRWNSILYMFENFQTKKLKEELVSQENGVLETQRQSFYNNQWVTSVDGIPR